MIRKELKNKARINLKEHIVLFVIVCAIASFIGAEFVGTLYIANANKNNSFDAIVSSVMDNGIDKTREDVDKFIQNQKENGTEMIGYSNGVFASSINAISSGSLYLIGFSVLKNIAGSSTAILIITICVALLVYFLFWYYIVNVFNVISRRVFLEGRTYKKVPFRRIIFLSKVKKWNRVSKTIFVKTLYETLWDLTIIGGFIKHYSYLMVPYILAENPDISSKEAITLSRKMMDGHKFEAFIIDLSFLGWDALGVVTLGISALLYSNPYQVATFSEFYVELREKAKKDNIENVDLLNDKYLYEKPESELINEEYKDVIEIINKEDYTFEKEKGIKYVLREFFCIHAYTEEEKKFEKQQLKEFVVGEYTPVLNKDTYPFRLFTIKPKETKHRIESINYLRHYSIQSIIFIFFIISFFGWVWEVMLYLINEGIFVNRGTLHGPWLPIYGGGSILILLCLSRFRKNIPLQFIFAVLLCGVLEYFTSVVLEATHGGVRWWDYSGYFLNLHGRICAEGLLTFGFGGLAMVYFIAPAIDNKLREIKNKKVLGIVAVILMGLYAVDIVYSAKNPNTGKGINDYSITTQKK